MREIKITLSSFAVFIKGAGPAPKFELSVSKNLFSMAAIKFLLLPLWLLKAMRLVWANKCEVKINKIKREVNLIFISTPCASLKNKTRSLLASSRTRNKSSKCRRFCFYRC